MEYGVKLVFHLPEYCIHGAEAWKCDNYNFRQELIDLLGKAGADYFFSIPAKVFIRGNEFSCEHLVIYSMEGVSVDDLGLDTVVYFPLIVE